MLKCRVFIAQRIDEKQIFISVEIKRMCGKELGKHKTENQRETKNVNVKDPKSNLLSIKSIEKKI